DAWIDFNADGDWDDPGEQIVDSAAVINGSNVLSFAVPVNTAVGRNYARFRLSTDGGLQPYGEAVDGEVEDLAITAPETSVTLDGSGNLVITDVNGRTSDDALTIQSDTTNSLYIITDPNNTITTAITNATGDRTNTVTI